MVGFHENVGFTNEVMTTSVEAELRHEVEILQEQWDEAAGTILRLRTEDEGWSILGQVKKTDGFSLFVLKELAKKAEVQASGNPLLKSAYELRFNPIFSRGMHIEGEIKPRYQKKLDNITVQELLFSEDGYDALERTCFTTGNLFLAYNRITGDAHRIPFEEIGNRAVDPDSPGRTAYYLWNHTKADFDGKTTPISEWLPVVEWWKSGNDTQDEIANNPVNHDWVMIDMRVNVPSTGHWGIPDAFPALPYAWAYSEYIRDAASLLKAHNTIAWKFIARTKQQAQAGGVSIAGNRRTAGVAAMTKDSTLEAVPKAGLVDMADGRALAAMVASATGVSTNALLSMAEGSGLAVQSMDGPTVAMARARQKRWANFYKRLFVAMGFEGISVNFPKITEDPIHRQVSSLATIRATGGLWADEYREAVLEAMSIKPLHDEAPDVEEYAQAQNAMAFLKMMDEAAARDDAENDPLSRQGNTGVAGAVSEIDNTNRNQDKTRQGASGTQTDLVG